MLRTLSRYWSAFRRWPAVFRWAAALFGTILVLALWPRSAHGQDPFLKGDALQADVVKNCAEGCITYSPAEAQELERQVLEFSQQAAQRAYNMGKADANARCASLI